MYAATITTAEVREEFLRIRAGKPTLKDRQIQGTIAGIQSSRVDHYFTGCSGDQMEDWVLNGKEPEGDALDVTMGGAEDQIVPDMLWDDEEGDLMVDAVLSGEDFYRVRWEDVPTPRSIRIVAQVNMLGGTPPEVLGAYSDFILRAVDAATGIGAAPGLEIVHYVKRAIQGENECRFFIPLVQPGETVDPTAWRAFFSIGGFRMLGFLARGIAAKKDRKKLGGGMGFSSGPGWNVTKDGDTITITCPPEATSFPEDMMAAKLAEALA